MNHSMNVNFLQANTNLLPDETYSRRNLILAQALAVTHAIFRKLEIRGWWYVVKIFSKVMKGKLLIRIKEMNFEIETTEPYWLRLVVRDFDYEIEIETLLSRIFHLRQATFLDLGANVGYWSCMCLSKYDVQELSVVEPNPEILSNLEQNLKLNGFKGEIIQKALAKESDKTVELHVDRNNVAGGSLLSSNHEETIFYVQTISINEVLKPFSNSDKLIVVKMDIEGVELEVFKESSQLGKQNIIYIYEDHGSDSSSKTTNYLLSTEKFHIWLLRPNLPPLFISRISTLNSNKLSKNIGYNMLAVPKANRLWTELDLEIN